MHTPIFRTIQLLLVFFSFQNPFFGLLNEKNTRKIQVVGGILRPHGRTAWRFRCLSTGTPRTAARKIFYDKFFVRVHIFYLLHRTNRAL